MSGDKAKRERKRRRRRKESFSLSAAAAEKGKRVLLSAAKPTDQGEEGVVLLGFVVVVVGGFGGTVFRSPMYTQKGCIQRKLFLKMGVSRGNFSSKWVHPEKSFPQKGCIQTKHFFKRGVSRQNFGFSFDVSQSKV